MKNNQKVTKKEKMSLLQLSFLCYIQNILTLNIPCSDSLESELVTHYRQCLLITSCAEKLNYYEKKELLAHKYEFHYEYKKLYQLYKKWGQHNLLFARVLDEIHLNEIPEIKKLLRRSYMFANTIPYVM